MSFCHIFAVLLAFTTLQAITAISSTKSSSYIPRTSSTAVKDNFGIVEPFPENIYAFEFTSANVTCVAYDSSGIKIPAKILFVRRDMFNNYLVLTANSNLYFTNRTEENGRKLFVTLHFRRITIDDDSRYGPDGTYECHAFAVGDRFARARHGFRVIVMKAPPTTTPSKKTPMPSAHPTLMPSKTPPCPCPCSPCPGNECPSGWESFDSFCYLAMSGNGTLTWHQAQQYCQEMGGDLVKITNEQENVFVLALARKKAPSMKQIYIGLRWTANAFYWSDYSLPVYKNWAPHEPNGNAREPCSNMWTGHTSPLPIRASGYWNDRPCHGIPYFPCGFVCKALP
ncbi:hypothetical protein ACROYT_G002800 [Oculina patagonica]